jgi:hypothetical protein
MRREWLLPPFGEIEWDYFFFAFFSTGISTMRLCKNSLHSVCFVDYAEFATSEK